MTDPLPDLPPPPTKRSTARVWLIVAACVTATIATAVVPKIWDKLTEPSEVAYRVTGTARRADVIYQTATGNTSSHNGTAIPTEVTVKLAAGAFAYVSAQNDTDSGTVTCAIVIDGKVKQTNTSSGAGAIATCSLSI